MFRPKIGLALGSGAAKGLAHIGVLKALEEAGIRPDIISGTSIGAVVGGAYCAGVSIQKLIDFAIKFGSRPTALWMDPSFFMGGGLIKGSRIEDALRKLTGPKTFSDLDIALYVVTTDLATGKEVIISNGDLHQAIRASISVPGVFSPIKRDEVWLADGALVAPIPTHILKEKGCDLIIAVNVYTPDGSAITSLETPSIMEVIIQALAVTQHRLAEHCMHMADIKIVPAVKDYNWTNFSLAHELIQLGYETTITKIPQINRLLFRKRSLSFFKKLFRL